MPEFSNKAFFRAAIAITGILILVAGYLLFQVINQATNITDEITVRATASATSEIAIAATSTSLAPFIASTNEIAAARASQATADYLTGVVATQTQIFLNETATKAANETATIEAFTSTPTITPTPVPSTATPTVTPSPTPTHTATFTPVPSPTITPTPELAAGCEFENTTLQLYRYPIAYLSPLATASERIEIYGALADRTWFLAGIPGNNGSRTGWVRDDSSFIADNCNDFTFVENYRALPPPLIAETFINPSFSILPSAARVERQTDNSYRLVLLNNAENVPISLNNLNEDYRIDWSVSFVPAGNRSEVGIRLRSADTVFSIGIEPEPGDVCRINVRLSSRLISNDTFACQETDILNPIFVEVLDESERLTVAVNGRTVIDTPFPNYDPADEMTLELFKPDDTTRAYFDRLYVWNLSNR